ncbi:Gfo/Idh/MocA family oxidoreductase [Bacillaceae bacterium SIJ1]|uniref:Gfo/Idh/MocA family protein n=1 Tax=Litoribacterium kuwaitense TaxID=1398745 RepID=UPI0013EB11F2|nr:Gfo/Idh/MocA family oxidoreductase [Litoribacterium kuwaitense]NGP45939.1 Gfo/Idh/MocA family oxidoreductase [Litoribacterium kuwaitense]
MKIGFISFAHMHAYSYASVVSAHPELEIAGIWDADEERGQRMASDWQTTYESSLETFLETEMDAVIICSENANHKEHVVKAAQAGKHILCEKPIATKVEDARVMIEACEQAGVILQIAYPVRFADAIQKARSIINEGELGEVLAVNGTNHGQMPGGWFIQPELSGGGAAADHIVHVMDLLRWILKDEVAQVYAELDTRYYDIDVEDCGLVSLQMEKGTVVTIDPSWSRPKTFPAWGDVLLEIVGTKGKLSIDATKEHVVYYNDAAGRVSQLGYSTNSDQALMADFIETIKNGGTPSITGEDGLRTLEVVVAAYESNRDKKAITNERLQLS